MRRLYFFHKLSKRNDLLLLFVKVCIGNNAVPLIPPTHCAPLTSPVCRSLLPSGLVHQVEGAVFRRAGRAARIAGTRKWQTVCAGKYLVLSQRQHPFTVTIHKHQQHVTLPSSQDDRGKFNFDKSLVINPETGEPVSVCVHSVC